MISIRSRISLSIVAGTVLAFAAVSLAAPGDVLSSFEAPCKYPTGLASDGDALYLLDWREAKLYQLDPATGAVRHAWDAPTLKPQGLAWGDGRVYVSDDHTGQVYAFDPKTGQTDNSFAAPGESPVGLAYGGGALYILESHSGKIYKVMPDDGTILGFCESPDKACTGMTFDGKYLWVANRIKDELYLVAPDTGAVIGILPAPGPYAAGLAWRNGHLWNADFQTRRVYELKVCDKPMYRLSDPREARVEFISAFHNYGPGAVRDLAINIALPEELATQTLLSAPRFVQNPTRTEKDRWGQPCALFENRSLAPGEKTSVSYSIDAKISAIRYLIIPEQVGTLADIPEDVRRPYTADGTRYLIDTPFIRETVKKVVGDEKNPYWIARRIFNYLIAHLEYEMTGGWDIPEVVLKRGKGSCSEYTYTFIALCRAAGLPARYQGSVVARGDEASVDDAFHRWAQIYLPNYGWVPVDPSGGDVSSPVDQCRAFGGLANRFLITTQGGGDSEYLNWNYNSYAHYTTMGYCKVDEDTYALWEPLHPAASQAAHATSQPADPQPPTCKPAP